MCQTHQLFQNLEYVCLCVFYMVYTQLENTLRGSPSSYRGSTYVFFGAAAVHFIVPFWKVYRFHKFANMTGHLGPPVIVVGG